MSALDVVAVPVIITDDPDSSQEAPPLHSNVELLQEGEKYAPPNTVADERDAERESEIDLNHLRVEPGPRSCKFLEFEAAVQLQKIIHSNQILH